MSYRGRWLLFSLCLIGAVALVCVLCFDPLGGKPEVTEGPSPEGFQGPVRLAVLVVFDQLRADYLERWQDHFVEDGFRRLQKEGAWFQNCHYPYADTKTGPGHASLLTGCSPETHGIIANDWYDRRTRRRLNCVASEDHKVVYSDGGSWLGGGLFKSARGVAPEHLCVPALGDVLKTETRGESRIVSLSLKDRSAVLPGGLRPDVCYWFDAESGMFVTSTYYRAQPHPWVRDFNRSKPAQPWLGKEWGPLYPQLNYERLCASPVTGEETPSGRHFLHPFKSLSYSPYGNNLLLKLAERAVEEEELGSRRVPDLLCVSFSCNDAVGHMFGPDSQEVLDVTLRSDLIVKELLTFLDDHVGRGRYLLALTADHGVCPLPEVSRARGVEAQRIPPLALYRSAEAFLDKTFGTEEGDPWIEANAEPWIYLNQARVARHGLRSADVEKALAGWLKEQPGILTAYTRAQLLEGIPPDDKIGQSVRKSFFPERSGDVAIVVKPYHLLGVPLGAGTTHGTPHAYDTHVPLLVYGPGIAAGIYKEPVAPQAVTPILAHGLGIPPPRGSETPWPECLPAK